MKRGPLPGFRDFYPDEFAQRAHIVHAWRDVARRYGFSEYDGPPLEPLDLYTAKSGDEIVGQLYAFDDKGGRPVALRPEMTPTVARMVAARAHALRKPVRWFSVPQLFRYERQQKGRLREHFQLNVDLFGEDSVAADAELLAVAIDIMRALGLTERDVVARVSDRRLVRAMLQHDGFDEAQQQLALATLDKLGREPESEQRRKLTAAGVADASADRLFTYATLTTAAAVRAAYGESPLLAEHLARMESYQRFLDALGVGAWVRLDLSIVRGLAYYTGIVFEIFDAQGEFRAICGGGRYDTLLESLGGVAMPALGFGMGDVVLGELLRSRELMPSGARTIDYWVAGDDDLLLPDVMRVAGALRARGRSVEFALRPQALQRQLKTAMTAGAERAVILRAGEQPGRSATIRTFGDGREESVALDAWLATA